MTDDADPTFPDPMWVPYIDRGPRKVRRHGARMKATSQQLIESYGRTKNVWETANEFGMCGQSVQERLVRLGIPRQNPIFSEAEVEVLRTEYTACSHTEGGLAALAKRMGRTKQFVCRQARKLGLTDKHGSKPWVGKDPEHRDAMSRFFKQWHAANQHPMLGKKHTQETRDKISRCSKLAWASKTEEEKNEMTTRQLKTRLARYGTLSFERKAVTWKGGWREIGGRRIYFRSRWEYNYAVFLQLLVEQKRIKCWEHEPKTFWFDKIKRGCRSYLPDFRVDNLDGTEEYHEVKGWMDPKSKTKIERMARYYPTVKLIVIDGSWFKRNGPKLCFLPGWERDDRMCGRPGARITVGPAGAAPD